MNFIDVHAHYDDRDYCPPDLPTLKMKRMDPESFQHSMREANVEVTIFFAGLADIIEAPETTFGLLEANRRLLDLCKSNPEKFACYLLVHPKKLSESIEIIENYHDVPNVLGVGEILPEGHFNGHRFDTPAMQTIADCAARHALPMNFHTGSAESVRQLEWLINRVPGGNYILAHAAGEAVKEGLLLMAGHSNVWMDLSVHAWKPGVREPLIKDADRSRLLFGSDFPIESHAIAIKHFHQIGFETSKTEQIARRNALKLFPKLERILRPNDFGDTPAAK